MASINKSNPGRQPRPESGHRYSGDGEAICNISLATTSHWKDKASGAPREKTEWHRVVTYNRLAEIACEYLKKSRPVYIEGRLETRKWQDRATGAAGAARYSTEIVADQMLMLGQRELGGKGGHAADAPDAEPRRRGNGDRAAREGSAPAADVKTDAQAITDMEDDIPF